MGVYVAWKSAYSVGEDSLDTQHKQILTLINEMHGAIGTPNERDCLKNCIDRLVQYTMTHFQHEEQIMQSRGYPDLANHKEAHEQMRRRTVGLQQNMKLMTGTDMSAFLKQWWVGHIQAEDQCYVPYITSGVRPGSIPPVKSPTPTNTPQANYSW